METNLHVQGGNGILADIDEIKLFKINCTDILQNKNAKQNHKN